MAAVIQHTSLPSTRPEVHVARKRRCLRCGVDFASEWAGERICPECKGNRAYRAAQALDNQPW